eukprot:jgi/Tetstr1/448566/TSEL_003783.t1
MAGAWLDAAPRRPLLLAGAAAVLAAAAYLTPHVDSRTARPSQADLDLEALEAALAREAANSTAKHWAGIAQPEEPEP